MQPSSHSVYSCFQRGLASTRAMHGQGYYMLSAGKGLRVLEGVLGPNASDADIGDEFEPGGPRWC